MLKTKAPSEGLLFGSFLFRADHFSFEELTSLWEGELGTSECLWPKHNPLLSYYEQEMGAPLKRIFFITQKKFPREFLLSTKILSLTWEERFAIENKRRVNVDVGFLTLENFILATTKIYSHRIYLGQNIFADLTYQFQNKQACPLPWTYPDYLDEEKKNFFLKMRKRFLRF